MIPDRQLTKNFRLHEFLRSTTAERRREWWKAQYNPPPKVVANLEYTALQLQKIRDLIETPIYISSGYRSKFVNRAVGGAATSQHVLGEAADISIREGNFFLFSTICQRLEQFDVDQVISEYGTRSAPAWVHFSTSLRRNRRQILRIGRDARGRREVLTAGSVEEALSWGAAK